MVAAQALITQKEGNCGRLCPVAALNTGPLRTENFEVMSFRWGLINYFSIHAELNKTIYCSQWDTVRMLTKNWSHSDLTSSPCLLRSKQMQNFSTWFQSKAKIFLEQDSSNSNINVLCMTIFLYKLFLFRRQECTKLKSYWLAFRGVLFGKTNVQALLYKGGELSQIHCDKCLKCL